VPTPWDRLEALADAGRIAEGLAVLVGGIEQSEAGWLTPELLRVKGELFLLQSSAAVRETAEDLFRQALDAARRDKALSWELRAAMSLARLLILGPVSRRAGNSPASLRTVHRGVRHRGS
jgi:hypothetical protein